MLLITKQHMHKYIKYAKHIYKYTTKGEKHNGN